MQVHISDSLSTAQKAHKVKGDVFIECMERPYTCWHPPFCAPAEDAEEDGFKLRWVGCGAVFPFGKRQVHNQKECPFRLELCKLGCGQKVLGYELEEHYKGKPLKFCRDTKEWLESGCPEREVPCMYVMAKERENPLEEGEEDPDDAAAARGEVEQDSAGAEEAVVQRKLAHAREEGVGENAAATPGQDPNTAPANTKSAGEAGAIIRAGSAASQTLSRVPSQFSRAMSTTSSYQVQQPSILWWWRSTQSVEAVEQLVVRRPV